MEWRYKIYLSVGNMTDILNMSFHDFKGVINQMIYENKPSPQRVRKLSTQQKKMIANKIAQKGD
jgi:hypothetical protein